MTKPPAFGAPPTVRALLAGAPLYGESVERDLYAHLALAWPTLVADNRLGLYRQVGDSWPMAELLQGAWRAAVRVLDKGRASGVGHPGRWATRTFHEQLVTIRDELGRLLDMRPAVDLDFDRFSRFADPLDEFHGRLTFYCTGLGEMGATQELVEMIWQAVRDAIPGGEDVADLYATAVGGTLLQGDAHMRWRSDGGLTDVVGQWRQHGRVALRDAVKAAAPARSLPSHVQAIVEARKEPVDDGPSLQVLASVAHLPGTAKDGGAPGTSSSTPRSEWAPMAGRQLPLIVVRDLARVRRRLLREFPDAERIIDVILQPLAGRRFIWLPPILLRGAPGTGKSRFARRLGEELGLAVTVYGCGAVADGSFIGTSRQWSTGRACVPLQAVKRAGTANALVILDEISRAGTRQENGRLTDGILALTERETAGAFHDPYLECAVDLSAVSYIATANDTSDLDPALLSRFRVLDMPHPTLASLPVLARGIAAEIRADRGLDEVWLPDLTPEEIDLVGGHWRGGSVRVLRALVECAVDGRQTGLTN